VSGRPRPAVLALPGYRPGRSAAAAAAEHGIADVIKLASNELPHGPLPSVAAALRAGIDDVQLYPDHRAVALRAAIAASLGVGVDHVTVGAGSVGLLQQLALSYVDRGDGVAFCWPSFEAYPQFAALVDGEPIRPSLRRQTFDLELLADVIDDDTRLALIANPNNPTGTVVGTDELTAFVERVPESCLVVIDEAYAEFVTDARIGDSMQLVERFSNVVLLRTFSKAHALASLRVGYAIARPEVIDVLDRTLVPFVVNGLAQTAAIASLGATDEMRERVAGVVAERSRVAAALREAGWMVPEPQGNFVWLPAGRASADIGVALERLGVVTRVFADVGIRVTVADPTDDDRFLDAFDKVVVDLDPGAWELPTGDLAVRIAGELRRLDDVLVRLVAHADQPGRAGLTAADEATGEQWEEGQVWAHLAEFGAYWRRELRLIVDAGSDDPVPFGRTKRDPHRIAMIEAHRATPVAELAATVQRDVAAFRADLAELTPADWSRRGLHETLGEMDLWRFLDHFVTGHYLEHADQLDGLGRG
jgi:histidinol-phosphate aminotransferase